MSNSEINFSSEGLGIDKTNVEYTLKTLLKTVQALPALTKLDFTIKITSRKKIGE